MKKYIVSFCILLWVKTLHAQNVSNLKVPIKYDYNNSILSLSILNPFQTPIRVMVTSGDSIVDSRFNNRVILLAAKQDTMITVREIEQTKE